MASALVGLGGLFALYEAGEHGGALVYSYAGGIGIRTGAPEDVGRLLLAGLYHQAQLDRKAQRPEDAAALIELAARRFPADPGVQLAAAESLLLDRKDAAAAVAALERTSVPPDDRRLRMRRASLLADAFESQGNKPAALAALEPLAAEFPQNERLKKRDRAAPQRPLGRRQSRGGARNTECDPSDSKSGRSASGAATMLRIEKTRSASVTESVPTAESLRPANG